MSQVKESSLIEDYAYSLKENFLRIKFKNNEAIYQYNGVSPKTYIDFTEAPSLGRFFNERIKNVYNYVMANELSIPRQNMGSSIPLMEAAPAEKKVAKMRLRQNIFNHDEEADMIENMDDDDAIEDDNIVNATPAGPVNPIPGPVRNIGNEMLNAFVNGN